MEKYRRWTDQRVGINPFVQPSKQNATLLGKVLSIIALVIKTLVFLQYLPIFILQQLIPINFIRSSSSRFMLYLFGVYFIEDFSVDKNDKERNITRILSNHCCFIDILYYLYKYPGFSFVRFSQQQGENIRYDLISPLKAFLISLKSLQPFYTQENKGKYQSLKDLIDDNKAIGLIIFYQKIRTNGKGTIRIDRQLCEEIYSLGDNYLITQIKYAPRKVNLFSLTSGTLKVLFSALGTLTPGNNIKIRASRQNSKDTHSSKELSQAIEMMAAGPLLQTQAKSFKEFKQFFQKTQNEGYKLE